MWGDEAAERHEMDQPSEPLAVDGTPRLNVRVSEAGPRWEEILEKAQMLSVRENGLRDLRAYCEQRAAAKPYDRSSAVRRAVYEEVAAKLSELLKVEL